MKKSLLRISTVASILAVSISVASGTSANLSWVAPTAYSDGSALPSGDIDHYTLTWAPGTGQSGPSGSQNIAGTALAAQVNVPCGSVSFTLSITTGPSAKYPNTTSSPTSAVPYITGIACTPNPPTGLAAH